MRNKSVTAGLNCLLLFFLFGPFINLQAQTLPSQKQVGDTTIHLSPDSMKTVVVRTPYYTIPEQLTAVSTDIVYNRDLVKNPVRNVLNSLVGRLTGVATEQFSGQPLTDDVSFSLHGRTPIVLIDGVARNLTSLDLDEIESVTLVKDALGTAMLGVRGANGALLITTRKGSPARQTISFTAQTAFQQPLKQPKALDAYNYALLRNEAVDNELRVNPNFNAANFRYSAADLQAFQDGTDPYGHPNVDWRNEILKKSSKLDRYNLNISGGNKTSRYFVALEHLSQQGLFKESDANPYTTNNGFKSYIARTNVDINVTPKLVANISLLGRIINSTEPGVGTAAIYSSLLTTPNNAYPVLNRDSSYSGNANYSNNLLAQITGSGYLQQYRRDILTDFNLRRSLDEITPGLWVKAKISYSSNLTENTTRTKPIVVFQPNGTGYTQIGVKADQLNSSTVATQGRSDYIELAFGYNHLFNGVHGFDAMILANRDNMVSGSDLSYTIKGTSGKISYNYKQRYILEGAFGYNGSNRYPGGKTDYGFFPSVGVAWNIKQENFMQRYSAINSLKLYATYGKSGWDNPGYFQYIQRYPNGPAVYFGTAAAPNTTLTQNALANTGITWEKANKLNIGIKGQLLENRLSVTAEYYNNKFDDLLIQRGRNTTILGAAYPNENIGQNRYTGFDFQLAWQQIKTSAFNYYVSANASIQRSEVLFSDEPSYPNAYMYRTGNTVGRPFGYVADGLFQSAADITGKPTLLGYQPQPGDIKFKDLNKDGVINQLDITAIGTDKPLTVFGLNLGFTFHSFDVSALFQGVLNRNVFLTGNAFYEFQNNGLGQAYEQHLDRWTPANTDATYPRLGIGANSNNQAFSSYWVRSGNYMRLKNAEIGYTMPATILKRWKLNTIRIFANGLNLLTFSKNDNMDPEVYNGSYPLQRLFNFGINIKL